MFYLVAPSPSYLITKVRLTFLELCGSGELCCPVTALVDTIPIQITVIIRILIKMYNFKANNLRHFGALVMSLMNEIALSASFWILICSEYQWYLFLLTAY